MENALVRDKHCKVWVYFIFVLILVLIENALVQQNLGNALFKRIVRLNCASKDLYLTNFMYLFSECKSSYFYGEAQNFYVKISAKHIKC